MFFDASRRIVLVLLDVEDGTSLHEIKTECGITVSPVAPAELIVYVSDSHCKVVFEAVYGASRTGRSWSPRRMAQMLSPPPLRA